MTPEQIEQIEARAAKARKGPWDKLSPDDTRINSELHEIAITLGDYVADWEQMERDAAFIRASRTDIPALCAALREAQERVDRMRSAILDYNENLRTAHSIAERDGWRTNWAAHQLKVGTALEKHHSTWLEVFAEKETRS